MPSGSVKSRYARGTRRGRRLVEYKTASAAGRSSRVRKLRMTNGSGSIQRYQYRVNKFVVNGLAENQQLFHNGGAGAATHSGLANICRTDQGVSQITRIGDAVRLRYVDLRFWLSTKANRPNVAYRILAVRYYHGFDPTSVNSLFALNSHPNVTLSLIDTDKFTVVHDKLIKPQPISNTAPTVNEHSSLYRFQIKFGNRVCKYQTNNGSIPSDERNLIAVYVFAYDAYGTFTTDNIASYAFQTTLYFADA